VSGLLGPADVRALAQRLGVRPTKALGQNFVHDANTVRRIVRAAQLRADEHVVEVGPGLGSLTLGLLEAGVRVTAIEIDPVLAAALPQTVQERQPDALSRLDVLRADAMAVDEIPGAPGALVANLPYNTAVPILLNLLERTPTLRTLLVMVQAEVAERLAAQPGSKTYGVPSVKIAWYASAVRAGSIPRSVFWPVPNVDSGLVRITTRPGPVAGPRREAFDVIDAAFSQRRKMLRTALAGWAGGTQRAVEVLETAGVDPRARGETLGVDDFVRIARAGSASGGEPGKTPS